MVSSSISVLLGVISVWTLIPTVGATENIRSNTECMYTHYATAYVGNVSITTSGKTCQRWDSQLPHAHSYTSSDMYPDDSVSAAGNQCRNPNRARNSGVWCYTTEGSTEWEYCDVPFCECKSLRSGHSYLGSHSTTYTGITCQRWDTDTPHAHGYGDDHFVDYTIEDANNYCRNPSAGWHYGTWCLTVSPNIRWQHCSVGFCECKTTLLGELYEGYKSVTRSGKQCQVWNQQTPHEHDYDDISLFADTSMSAVGSHCRNPDASQPRGPWCFTTDPDQRWEYCDIPMCEYLQIPINTTTTTSTTTTTEAYTGPTPTAREVTETPSSAVQQCKFSRTGSSYRGLVDVTVTGKKCQTWTAQTPHKHPVITNDRMADVSVADASNHCRNPDSNLRGPWCFTTSADTRFEYCNIPLCECKVSRAGIEYTGLKQTTRSGLDCQVWHEQSPHRHSFNDVSFGDGGVAGAENFCRNPGGLDPNGPWCLTTDPLVRWEYCGIPYCECKDDEAGMDYAGKVKTTVSGKTCQRWDSQSPHPHTFDSASMFPTGSVHTANNYCRNPDDQRPNGPWCYTTDPAVIWEYCDISLCELPAPPTGFNIHAGTTTNTQPTDAFYGGQDCKLSRSGETYRGPKSHTVSFYACQSWSTQTPHAHPHTQASSFPDATVKQAGNRCRNPDRVGHPAGPWCYTMNPLVEWEYCSITDCGCKKNKLGGSYNGTMSETRLGYTCQRWGAQTPQSHAFNMTELFPDKSVVDAANFCRNPGLHQPQGPWCFTTDPAVTWDYCNIPYCECITTQGGHEYGGRVNTTNSGLTCQRWDQQVPHKHQNYLPCLFPDKTVEEASNFCRNPEQENQGGPWCFTTSENKVWDYCDLPKCEADNYHPFVLIHGNLEPPKMMAQIAAEPIASHASHIIIVFLTVLVIILSVCLILLIILPRRQQIANCLIEAKQITHNAFDNPLYSREKSTAGNTNPGAGFTKETVKLDLPDMTLQPPDVAAQNQRESNSSDPHSKC